MAFVEITNTYLRDNSLSKQYVSSYDKFIDNDLQKIVDAQSVIEPQIEGVQLKLGKIRVEKPAVAPNALAVGLEIERG